MKNTIFSTIGVFILFLAHSNLSSAQSNYQIDKISHVTGDGGWDYLATDETNGRLFISHSTVVQIIDCNSDSLIGTIPNTIGVHGIAIAYDLNKGFISDGKDSTVTVFDLQSLKTITVIHIQAKNPDAILYEPSLHRVYTFNGGSKNATVIDGKSNKVIATIPLNCKPEFAVTDGSGKIYFNMQDKNMVGELNSQNMQLVRKWSITPGEDPSGLAIDAKTHRLFSVCGNKWMVICNAQKGKVVTCLPIGDHCDGVTFDPDYERAYASNGDGTMTVVQEGKNDQFNILETVSTKIGARTITINKKTHHIYLVTASFDPTPSTGRRHPTSNSFILIDLKTIK